MHFPFRHCQAGDISGRHLFDVKESWGEIEIHGNEALVLRKYGNLRDSQEEYNEIMARLRVRMRE